MVLTTPYHEDELGHNDGLPGALFSSYSSNTPCTHMIAFTLDIPGAYHTMPHRLTWLVPYRLLSINSYVTFSGRFPPPNLVLATPFCPNHTAYHHVILYSSQHSSLWRTLFITVYLPGVCLTLSEWKLYDSKHFSCLIQYYDFEA